MSKTTFIVQPGTRDVIVTRMVDAPRELVYKAYTDATLIPRWWGPAKYSTTVEKQDLKPGGGWRYVQADASGQTFAFRGEFKEVIPNERISWTFEFEPMAGHISLQTVTFENVNGKTLITVRALFDTVEERDGMVGSGMEGGMDEGYDRLDALLKTIA